jgi:hypothetical protein
MLSIEVLNEGLVFPEMRNWTLNAFTDESICGDTVYKTGQANQMNRSLERALRHVQLPARGLWWDLYPIMQRGEPYGTLEMSMVDLASAVNVSVPRVRQAMSELIECRIIRRIDDEIYSCPMMRDERRNTELRNEIRTVFARWQRVQVR